MKSPLSSSLRKCHFGGLRGLGVPNRALKRVRHQKYSYKAKTLYPGVFWGGEFHEIDNIWWNWNFSYLRAFFVILLSKNESKLWQFPKLHQKVFRLEIWRSEIENVSYFGGIFETMWRYFSGSVGIKIHGRRG